MTSEGSRPSPSPVEGRETSVSILTMNPMQPVVKEIFSGVDSVER